MKPLLFFLIVFASQSANLADSLVGRLGLKADYFSVGLTSLACAALIIRRHTAIVVSASLLMIMASLPSSMTGAILDRDYLYGLFVAALVAPYVVDRFEESPYQGQTRPGAARLPRTNDRIRSVDLSGWKICKYRSRGREDAICRDPESVFYRLETQSRPWKYCRHRN